MTAPNLTLMQIETELLELCQLRDELAAEVQVSEEGAAERNAALEAVDAQIEAYVQREVQKADNIAGFLRECKGRAAALKAEEERLRAKRKRWEENEQRVKDRVAEVLAMQVDPQAIAAAHQNQVLKRVNGRTSELKLCKSPGSVEVTDMSLLPDQYKSVTVTLPLSRWEDVLDALLDAGKDAAWSGVAPEPQPDKRAIAAALKAGPVPGARLVEDSVHLRIA